MQQALMEAKSVEQPHRLTLDSRSRLSVTGVLEVESFDETEILLTSTRGSLSIRGQGLRLQQLSIDGGQVLVDGEDMNGENVDRRRIRQKVGLVFQYPEYQLFEETIAKDIAFGPKNQGLSEEEIDQRVRRAMAHVHLDYDKYAERSPFDLSGGQMRRVAIAGVLAMEPKVLILDEPAAGLDPRGRERILGMLQELHREGGVTIVMVSHSMDDCARLATRMIVMSKGELVLTDSPRNVFRQGDLMRSIGLGVPEAAELCGRLRAAGLQLPDDLFTQEELHDHLLRLWKEKQEKEAAK